MPGEEQVIGAPTAQYDLVLTVVQRQGSTTTSAATHHYTVHVHQEGPGEFWAQVEELPGCVASGATMDELWEALAEALDSYLFET